MPSAKNDGAGESVWTNKATRALALAVLRSSAQAVLNRKHEAARIQVIGAEISGRQ